jgi:ABC-type sugar transport system ATPase subunit
MSVLAVNGVTKRFGPNTVLKNISLSLGAGEVHAICGENGAGKSTLVKILTGLYAPDEGTVLVNGQPATIQNPQHAQELGIALVAQELSVVPALSVLDNIWLGNRKVPLFHRRKSLRAQARVALDRVGLSDLSLDAPVSGLSIGRRQLVEIARMLTRDARILFLDEPSATLSDVEIERIFEALRSLKGEGKTIVYITHRLGEVFEICDSVTVLRNGELVGTRPTSEIDRGQLMQMMLGRSIGEMYPNWQSKPGSAALTIRNLQVPPFVKDFDLVAERGTVTCIAGQLGSGALTIPRALAGLSAVATGEVSVHGKLMRLRSTSAARAANVQFISEDRAGEGIFLRLSVGQNLVATKLRQHTNWGVLARAKLRATAAKLAGAVGVDRKRLRSLADELSGGNQQKLAFGRWIDSAQPGVLLMNEPTRGVDVGARAEIYSLVRAFCDQGYCVVVASSDIEEVLGIADRIISMYRGRQIGSYPRGEADMHRVMADITHPATA